MAVCASNPKYTGRTVPLEFLEGCGDVRPDSGSYIPVGALNVKAFNLSADEIDATADDTVGGVKETLVTYMNFEVSGDGKARNGDGTVSNHARLVKYFVDEMAAGRQPNAWIRLTFPDITIEAYCVLTDPGSRSAPDTDSVTFTFAAKATSSDFGVIVEDTP